MKYLLTNQETDRLIFRKLENSDFAEWITLFDDDTARMLGMEEFTSPEERCEKWFEWTFNRYDQNLGGQNVLISKKHGQIVGQCGLLVREINGNFEIEIAYSILQKFRGKGYAAEGVGKCKDFAFENNFHNRLLSIIIPENFPSKNVALNNKMKNIGQINYNNKRMDLFEITKNDWELDLKNTTANDKIHL